MRLLLIPLLFNCVTSFAQDTLFYENEGGYESVYLLNDGESLATFNKYDSVGHLLVEGQYKLNKKNIHTEPHVRQGLFVFYYPNGQKQESGRYEKNWKEGAWKSWYPNGTLKDVINYEAGFVPNTQENKKYIAEFYDSLGKQLVENGKGYYEQYNNSMQLVAAGYVKRGKKVGEWKGWYGNGKLYYNETYKRGELIQGDSYDVKGNKYHYKYIYEASIPHGGYYAFYNYVQRSMKYPKSARRHNVQGKVYIQFVVNEEGELTEVKSVKGIGSGCDQEGIRVIKEAPQWKVPKDRGQKTTQRIILPITFKLG